MKALILNRYGSLKDLSFEDIPKPTINDDEVLIRIMYTSLNSADLDYIHGHPLVRFTGLRKPGYPILGSDCVGEVAEIGEGVVGFKNGNMVWADLSTPANYGTFAEYVKVKAFRLQKLPEGMDLVDAACLPTAAMVALQNVRIKNGPKQGDKVLVNGAGGGIGTILVQLLKQIGTEVTAVDKKMKHPMLLCIGADSTVDYQKDDFTEQDIQYDFIYDLQSNKTHGDYKKVLKKNGVLIVLGGTIKSIISTFFQGPFLRFFLGRQFKVGGWDTNNHDDLKLLSKLYFEGKIKPVIDQVLPFDELISGLKLLESGNVIGKIVIKVSD